MKLSIDNIKILDKELEHIGEISDNLVKMCFHKYIEPVKTRRKTGSKSSRKYHFKKQYKFVKQDLLKIKYKRNGMSAKGIPEGYVYAIGNPNFPGMVKFGSSIDVRDRLQSYQTYSPYRDYYLIGYVFVPDRLKEEKILLEKYCATHEWAECSEEEAKLALKELDNKFTLV